MKWLNLLSKKPVWKFAPEEFKSYIKSLNWDPPKRKSKAKPKKAPAPFIWRKNVKGTLILKVNRKPKWLTEAEVTQIATESEIDLAVVLKKVRAKASGIELRSEEELLPTESSNK